MIKTVLIGSNGQLGTDIKRYFDNDYELISLTHQELDISDFDKTRQIIQHINPQIVINTAAYHRVDEAEKNPKTAYLINYEAQKNLATVCQEKQITNVFISTDYVFGKDFNRQIPYRETDDPQPINIYGQSKLKGEMATKLICKNHFIIRTCGLFGVAGSSGKGGNFIENMINLAKSQKKISVVDDQIISPTYTVNLVNNLNLLLKTNYYGLYHMVSNNHCSWYQLAKKTLELLKISTQCIPVKSSFFKTLAPRPFFSALENHNLDKIKLNKMQSWEKNLKDYLREKKYI